MTPLSRVLSVFPALHGACVLASAVCASRAEGPFAAAGFALLALLFLYVAAPLAHRLHARFHPVRDGFSSLSGCDYSPWWGSHQIQGLYIAFPAVEAALRLVPGAYSAWLRLWGARIGKGVYWTPAVDLLDRPMLRVGDHVVFGHRSVLCAHVVMPKGEELRLFVKSIEIGPGALLGAETRIGPGTVVEEGARVPHGHIGKINERIRSKGPSHD